eukprot:1193516-Prorocentrum_minimum.AAC.1
MARETIEHLNITRPSCATIPRSKDLVESRQPPPDPLRTPSGPPPDPLLRGVNRTNWAEHKHRRGAGGGSDGASGDAARGGGSGYFLDGYCYISSISAAEIPNPSMACSTHISHKHLAGPGCYTYFFLRQSPNGPQGGIRVKGNDVAVSRNVWDLLAEDGDEDEDEDEDEDNDDDGEEDNDVDGEEEEEVVEGEEEEEAE